MSGDGPGERRFTSVRISYGASRWTPKPAAPPPSAQDHLAAAHRLLFEGKLEEAAAAARAAAQLEPANAEAHGLWGAATLETGSPAEAELILARAAELCAPGSPEWSHVASLRARALVSLCRWAEAEALASRVERAWPADPAVRDRLGEVFTRINLADRGAPHFEAAVRARPERPDFQFDLASGYRFVGRLGEAESAYERAIGRQPDMAKAHMALAELKRWTPADAHLERLERLWRSDGLWTLDRARIGYALFKEFDDLRMCDAAWPYLVESSELAREVFGAWSANDEAAWVEAMIEAFPGAAAAPAPAPRSGRTRFIFVVGFPRSGTTLVERILAAHSQVTAMGELPIFGALAKQASGMASPELLDAETVRAFAGVDWAAVAERYRRETAYLSRGAPFAIDKLPDNLVYVGAIRRAFPDALIIRLRRDPMDVLFGAYRLLFHKAHYWSYRQEDLAGHHALWEGLGRHWREALGDGLIEVSYEDLVADPDAVIPTLVRRCDLAWEAACLRPHETAGAVSTASSTQVREPISRSRQGAWRRYEARLKPLSDALGL